MQELLGFVGGAFMTFGIYSTGVASFQTQECTRDKFTFHYTIPLRYSLLANLRNSSWSCTCSLMECNIPCSRISYVVREVKIKVLVLSIVQ